MMKQQDRAIKTTRGTRVMAVLCMVSLLLATAWYALPVHGEKEIYDAVIRLHVIAASDEAHHQADKLAVRDAVLELAANATAGCESREEAVAVLTELHPSLERAALAVLRERGSEDSVRVLLGEESYPTRTYDDFHFPAGEYLSLRVVIGEGEGQNFWCVLFPPMCLSAAQVSKTSAEDAMISVGLRPEQYRVITETQEGRYRLRFRILEFWEELR